MPRTMNPGGTNVCRALVEKLYPNGKVFTKAYGPYDASTSCRNMEPSEHPTRVSRQVLKPSYREGRWSVEPGLEWVTEKVTYTNGGKDVDWDDQ